MPVRTSSVERITKETQIKGTLKIEGKGRYEISTGIRFLDHMLELFTKHGGFDLKLDAKGDLDVDQHHTVEDVGIVLGQLFAKALGDRKGINRAGYFVLPMDETLAVVAVDLGGRPALVYKDKVKVVHVGDLQTELLPDFFDGFVVHCGANLHGKILYGRSSHHKIEAIFKLNCCPISLMGSRSTLAAICMPTSCTGDQIITRLKGYSSALPAP